jgi:UDP-glucose 4-epimerase
MHAIGRGSWVLVTGGAGFIGASLVRRLRAEGFLVRVLDDLSHGHRERLDGTEAELVVGDVRSERSVRDAVAGMSAIVHLAAVAPEGGGREERIAHDVNVTGTLNLLAAAMRERVNRVVVASSSSVYGARVPYLLHEDLAPHPSTAEGAQKTAAEGYARLYAERDGLPTVVVRLFSVFGPERTTGVVARFVEAARQGEQMVIYGDGSQTRDLLHVDDVAGALCQALQMPGAANRTFNLASGESVAIRHLAAMVSELGGLLAPPRYAAARPGEAHDVRASVAAAASALGFRARVRLRDGLAACLGMDAAPPPPMARPRPFAEGSESKVAALRHPSAPQPQPRPQALRRSPPPPPPVAAPRSTPLFGDKPASFLLDEDEISFRIDEDDDVLISAPSSTEAWS